MTMFHRLTNSKKQNVHQKRLFIQNFLMKILQKKIINIPSKFGTLSIAKHFKIIMIFISNLMFFFLLMYLKISEKLV